MTPALQQINEGSLNDPNNSSSCNNGQQRFEDPIGYRRQPTPPQDNIDESEINAMDDSFYQNPAGA